MRRNRRLVWALWLIVCQLLPASVIAHGVGTPRLLNEPAGPYLISVWTDPYPLRADESHVTVAVIDPETQAPLVESVIVTVELTQGDVRLSAPATTATAANKTLYEAVFTDLPAVGTWQATITADGPDGRSEPVSFPVEVQPALPLNALRPALIGLGAAALILLVWRARRGNAVAAPRRRPPRPSA